MPSQVMPPEITSALIHSGPGAESLLAAAAAWRQLSTTLEDGAASYDSTLMFLGGHWSGASWAAMHQAAEPYVSWLRSTASQAQQVAASAEIAAAAFNTIQAAVVPTAVVTANRTRLAQLLATNGFGRNLPAIAEVEAAYQEMWANNDAAMSRYQATSAQALRLPQFSAPTAQKASIAASKKGGATPASAFPTAGDPTTGYVGLSNTYANQFLSSGFPINLLSYLAQSQSAQALQGVSSQIGQGVSEGEQALGGAASNLSAAASGALGNAGAGLRALGVAGLGEVNTSAALGAAIPMGSLSAPPGAATLLRAPVQLASAASPLPGGLSGAMMPPLMPPALSPGSGWRKRKPQNYDDMAIGAELRGKFIKPPPSAG